MLDVLRMLDMFRLFDVFRVPDMFRVFDVLRMLDMFRLFDVFRMLDVFIRSVVLSFWQENFHSRHDMFWISKMRIHPL